MAYSKAKLASAKIQPLTHERLLELLHYSPETGEWLRRKTKGKQIVGSVAGYIHKGYRQGYRKICIDGQIYRSHKLAIFYMTGDWPKVIVDHENCIPSDDRYENLREATISQNNANKKISKRNTSGIKGVYWHKHDKRWCVKITVAKKQIWIGSFLEKEKAAEAYAEAAERYFGEFARCSL